MFPVDSAPMLIENRNLAKRPSISKLRDIQTYPAEFDAYFRDHFGFRRSLIHAYYLARLVLLGNRYDSEILTGKEGWLYYNAGGGMSDDYRAVKPFSEVELKHWAEVVEDRRAWLEDLNIRYLFVVAPDKNGVYPEYLPDAVRKSGTADRYAQLLEYLKANTRVPIVDLRESLRAAKIKFHVPLYHKTDSHCNDLGAFVADREIGRALAAWFPDYRPHSLEEFNAINHRNVEGLDLAKMMSLQSLIREPRIDLVPVRSIQSSISSDGLLPGKNAHVPTAITTGNVGLPSAVVFHDSFAQALTPFMVNHFSRVVLYWQSEMDPEVIELERPNVVIDEIVERSADLGGAYNDQRISGASRNQVP